LEEGRFLTGETTPEGIARFYRQAGARLVVIKLGAEGAYFDGEVNGAVGSGHVPGFPVAEVVDTVGAGDGFAVGVISALLAGRSVSDAVRRGAWIGARAVQVAAGLCAHHVNMCWCSASCRPTSWRGCRCCTM